MSASKNHQTPWFTSYQGEDLPRGSATTQWATFLGLIAAGVASRLLWHPENLTAIGAVALFGGMYFRRSSVAVLVPLIALLISDFALSIVWFGGSSWSFPPAQYVLFGLTVFFGVAIRRSPTALPMLVMTIAGSVMYFLLSNLSAWYINIDNLYARNLAGLIQCYIAGLPFARNMLIGNLLYGALLLGAWHAAAQWADRRELTPAKVPV